VQRGDGSVTALHGEGDVNMLGHRVRPVNPRTRHNTGL
jgi:hypothetical protein